MARTTRKTRTSTKPAATSSKTTLVGAVSLNTLRPTITFLHGDGSFAGAEPRAVRIVASGPHKGQLGVERRKRILPIEVTGPRSAKVLLTAQALVEGYADAQVVAPVATLAQLGVKRAAKAAPPATRKGKASPSAISADDALEALRAHIKGKPLAEVQEIMAALVTK